MSIPALDRRTASAIWPQATVVLLAYLGGAFLSQVLSVPHTGLRPWQMDLAVALIALQRLGLRAAPPLLIGAGLAAYASAGSDVLPALLGLMLPLTGLALAILPGWKPEQSARLRTLLAICLCAALASAAAGLSATEAVTAADRLLAGLATGFSLLSAPAITTWWRSVRSRGAQRLLAIPVGLLVTLSVVVYLLLVRESLDQAHDRLSDMAHQSAIRLQRDMNAYIVALRAVEALFASSSTVTREEFDNFAESLQRPLPGLYAVAWDAYVTHEQRDSFIADMRASGLPEFEIFEVDEHGQRRPVPERPYYVPVAYARYEGMPLKALGYDMASEPTRKAALDQALYQGVPVASGRIRLVTDPDPHYDILVLMTMRGASEPVQLIGYAGLAVRVSELLQSALQGLPDHVEGRLFDLSAPRASAWLHGLPAEFVPGPGWLSAGRVLEIAGRRWELELIAEPAFVKAGFPHIALFCLWGGLSIAASFSLGLVRLRASPP